MATTIERPVYFEGQILGANDLQQSLDYSRDENARHERYLHSWGIAEGLDVKQRADDFVLEPGFAIDSSGAPIVVPESVVLDRQQLIDEALLSGSDEGRFPVFVARAESDQTGGQEVGRCSSGAATRRSESFAVRFRRIATGWDQDAGQAPPAVTDGPDDARESSRVVLIGFVQWTNEDGGQIVGFSRRDKDIIPRYAGVRADEILGRGGTLTLRSRKPALTDAPMVIVDHHDENRTFVLGLDDGKGSINEVLTVDAKGNVKAKGNIQADGSLTGSIKSGDVLVESGLAVDGVTLPLPSGIDEAQVLDGSVVVHITVTPRIDFEDAPKTTTTPPVPDPSFLPVIVECSTDDQRIVRCTIRWFKIGGSEADVFDVAGAVSYMVIATVAAKESDS